jgi:GNAT superfamily N-acetyltransferase
MPKQCSTLDIRLQAIRHQCIGAYTTEQMLAWTKGSAEDGYSDLMEKHFYLRCVRGELVATGMLDLENSEIGAIFVLPDFMQKGIGLRILNHLEGLARKLGLDQVNLDATLNAADFTGGAVSLVTTPLFTIHPLGFSWLVFRW